MGEMVTWGLEIFLLFSEKIPHFLDVFPNFIYLNVMPWPRNCFFSALLARELLNACRIMKIGLL